MKSFFLGCALAALGALAGAPADAQTDAPGRPLTRAEVTAELARARSAGELDFRLAPVLDEPAAPRRARPARHVAVPAPAAGPATTPSAPPSPPDAERLAAHR